MDKCLTSEIALIKVDSIDLIKDALLEINSIRNAHSIGLDSIEVVVYLKNLESNKVDYKFYKANETISITNNKKKKSQINNHSILNYSNQISERYSDKIYLRNCYVEDGSEEVVVIYFNGKISSIFVSKGFGWSKRSEDERLKTFYAFMDNLKG